MVLALQGGLPCALAPPEAPSVPSEWEQGQPGHDLPGSRLLAGFLPDTFS